MDLKSIYGYSTGSPYASNPYLDISSPTGEIQMENTPIDLTGIDELGNMQFMKAGRKKPYKFPGTTIREIPVKQRGGYSQRELVNYIFDDSEDEQFYTRPEVQQEQEIVQEEQPDLRAEYERMLQEEINNQLLMDMSTQEDYVRRPSPYNEDFTPSVGGGVMGSKIDPRVQSATNELLQKFPKLKITSTIRNWGDKDAHPKGRAIDLAGEDVDKAWEYYSKEIVPKYGFNKALNPKHGTGKHIHVGYYQTGGPFPQQKVFTSQKQIDDANKWTKEFLKRRNASQFDIQSSVVATNVGDPVPQFVGNTPMANVPQRRTTLPSGVTMNDVMNTSEGYGYLDPVYGNWVPVDPSAIYSLYGQKKTQPSLTAPPLARLRKGGYRKLR